MQIHIPDIVLHPLRTSKHFLAKKYYAPEETPNINGYLLSAHIQQFNKHCHLVTATIFGTTLPRGAKILPCCLTQSNSRDIFFSLLMAGDGTGTTE